MEEGPDAGPQSQEKSCVQGLRREGATQTKIQTALMKSSIADWLQVSDRGLGLWRERNSFQKLGLERPKGSQCLGERWHKGSF